MRHRAGRAKKWPGVCCGPVKKRIFKSQAKAKQSAKIQNAHGKPKLYPYLCDHCNHWHLTSLKQEKRNDIQDTKRR